MAWPRSLRWRFALFSTLLVAVALGAVGAIIGTRVEDALIDAAEQHLRTLVRPALLKPGASGRPEDDPRRVAESLARAAAAPTRWVVVDAGGSPIAASARGAAATGDPLPPDVYTSVLSGGHPLRLIVAGSSPDTRAIHAFVPLGSDGRVTGLVHVSAPLDETEAMLAALRGLVLGGILLALVASVVVAVPLVRLTLQPLDRMLVTVRRIGAGDLSGRVGLRGASGDLGELAAAFDAMLDRVEASFEALRSSEERTKRFAADASHELRSPLTALGGYTDLLLAADGDDPSDAERKLLAMRREIDRMGRLVADLLLLARLDAAAPAPAYAQVDLSAVASDAVQQASAIGRGPSVTARADGPVVVAGDADELRRVVGNLIDNAVRHTPARGRVEVETARHDGRAVLRVRDTGEGIAAEHLPRIFDRFYRPDVSRRRASGSAGLGLAIARAIARAHGGEVGVESALGAGSTFTMELPLAPATASAAQQDLGDLQAASQRRHGDASGRLATVVSHRSER